MDLVDAIKWAALYRLIALGSFLVGVGIIAAGVVAGVGDAVIVLLENPLDPGTAAEEANPAATAVLFVIGFVVWQVGATVGLYYTFARATGQSAAEEFDTVRLKSEVLEGLDERLQELEDDVAATRAAVDPDEAASLQYNGSEPIPADEGSEPATSPEPASDDSDEDGQTERSDPVPAEGDAAGSAPDENEE